MVVVVDPVQLPDDGRPCPGRVYVTARNGTTVVVSHDGGNRALAGNRLDDVFSASAAVVGRELSLRGRQALYCIAKE